MNQRERQAAATVAEQVARSAGALLLDYSRRELKIELKGEIDLVTDADRASETLIRRLLAEQTPDYAVLGEEEGGAMPASRPVWIFDPLDGTTNYAHHYPAYTVSIALWSESQVQLGVVLDPSRNDCFAAWRGGGARLNGQPIHVSRQQPLLAALLVTGFPYNLRDRPGDNLREFGAFLKRAQALRRDGSAALDLAYVACGRFDGFWEPGLKSWDVAAGFCLVEEAGGLVTGDAGQPIAPGDPWIVASNGLIHQEMLSVLREIDPRRGA